MSESRVLLPLRWLAFAVLLVAASALHEGDGAAVDMAVVWLPSGVAVAGVYLLGLGASGVVAAATFVQRWWLGYDWGVGLMAASGSTAEALIGALVLRQFAVALPFRRLRDVGAVLVTAAVAPLGSILASWVGRTFWWWPPDLPFYSGWDGWWRMNALAIIMVLPAAFCWLGRPSPRATSRLAWQALAGAAAGTMLLLALLLVLPQDVTGVMWLVLVLVGLAMFVASRYGMLGATLGALVASVVVVLATVAGLGPFIGLPRADRHVALQLGALALVGLPPAFAAMLAERRAAEAAVRRSEALLASINRNVQDGIFRADHDLRLVYANQALARMLGHDATDAWLGTPIGNVLQADACGGDWLDRLRRHEAVDNEEVLFRRRDGTTFWGLVSGTVVLDSAGGGPCYDGAIRDVTARKALEQQVRESQKLEAVGRLAGGIAHDFNNLLTVILGHAEVLRFSAPPGDPVAEQADAISEAGTRAAGLTRQLLAYSRRQVMSPQVLDVSEVVDEMAGMIARLVGEDLTLVVDHRPGPAWARVDRNQLEQVLLNLVVNARDAMPRGGTLTVSTSVETLAESPALAHADWTAGPSVVIRVHDTGVGMDAEVLSQAFEPFFTTKEPGRGTGLGLATVYGIVKQSGGAVWLESTPGAGTTACVALPLVDAPEPVDQTLSSQRPARSRRAGTILVVEDEPALLALLSRALTLAGYRVLSASDGRQALEVARGLDRRADLVVTDVVMPGLDGRELARRLEESWPDTRFLFMSGYSEAVVAAEGLMQPGSAFIAKPFSIEALLSRVDTLVPPPPGDTTGPEAPAP